jgi:hypothetical protein
MVLYIVATVAANVTLIEPGPRSIHFRGGKGGALLNWTDREKTTLVLLGAFAIVVLLHL